MFDRVLDMSLEDFIVATQRYSWKFYEYRDDGSMIRVEIPRGEDTLVLMIDASDEHAKMLKKEGFILQEKQWGQN